MTAKQKSHKMNIKRRKYCNGKRENKRTKETMSAHRRQSMEQ